MDKRLTQRDETISTLQTIVQQQREALSQFQHEKLQLEKKLQQFQSSKMSDDLISENTIRRLKQDLERKEIECEQILNRQNSSTQGLTLIKLKSQLEEPHQIEIAFKDQQISDQGKEIKRLQQQIQILNEKIQLIMQSHQNELAQTRDKFNSEHYEERLQMKQLQQLNILAQRDSSTIQELLKEKDLLMKNINQKDLSLKEMRQQLEIEKRNKDINLNSLISELEQEKLMRTQLFIEKEHLEEQLRLRELEPKQHTIQNPSSEQSDIREIQNRLTEYISLFEDEKDQKRKLNIKLNQIIQQTKQEKIDNDRVYETRIKELQEQLKEERNIKQKQQMKMKDQQADIVESKHEIEVLTQEKDKLQSREKDVESKERKLIEKEFEVKDKESKLENMKDQQELLYDNKKVKTKYKAAKVKLDEANQKIIVLLARLKDKQGDTDHQRKQIEKNVFKDHNYDGYYNLQKEANYLKDPYMEQLDKVSTRLREDLFGQKKQLEHIEHTYNHIK